MSKAIYRSHLRGRLLTLEGEMKDAEKLLAGGSLQQRVDAAGALSYLERHITETRAKLARLEAEPDGIWENFKTGIEQNIDSIEAALGRWIERQDYAFGHAPEAAEDGETAA